MDSLFLGQHIIHIMAFIGSLSQSRAINAGIAIGGGPGGAVTCEMNGRHYSVGTTWHPVVEPMGLWTCVNCTCNSTGKAECYSPRCPRAECDRPRLPPGECCPTCQNTAPVPSTEAPSNGPGDAAGYRGCRFHRRHYRHGDTFPSNKTGIRAGENQCVLCSCVNSKIVCYLKSCPKLTCKGRPIYHRNECCPMCKEDVIFTTPPPPVNPHNKTTSIDCTSTQEHRVNGSVWHPYVPPFGTMGCIVCGCVNGVISCRSVHCPKESSLPCRHPTKKRGECCSSCPKRRCRRRKRGKKGRKCKRGNKRGRSRISIVGLTKRRNFDINDLCLPLMSDRFVYVTFSKRDFAIAFEIYNKGQVEVLKWDVAKGQISDMKQETMQTEFFRKRHKISKVIGATDKVNYRRFKRRLGKHMHKCNLKTTPCKLTGLKRAIQKILHKINTRKVQRSKKCTRLLRST